MKVTKRTHWLVVLTVGLVLAGCGGGNRCNKACKKVKQCYGDAGGAPPCTLSATCAPAEECQAGCINNASCETIKGTDQAGQQAMQACIAQCASKPPPPDQGPLPEGGMLLDGPPPVLDLPPLPDDFFVPPDSAPSGPPVAKFCNNVVLGGNNFTATFTVGSGASQVTFTAYSGECSTKKGIPCIVIPTGSNLPLEVKDGSGQSLWAGSITQAVNSGEEWMFIYTLDSSTSEAVLEGGPFRPGNKCSTTDPFIP
jgi:hypothetical protein